MEQKYQSEIVEALKTLGYVNINELPSLKELRKEFFNSARKNHPDKNSKKDQVTKNENEETFKRILNAYNIVAEAIIENVDTLSEIDEEEYETEDQGDEEICYEDEFREVNITKTNAMSVTIKIPPSHAEA